MRLYAHLYITRSILTEKNIRNNSRREIIHTFQSYGFRSNENNYARYVEIFYSYIPQNQKWFTRFEALAVLLMKNLVFLTMGPVGLSKGADVSEEIPPAVFSFGLP